MSEHELWNELGNLYFLSGAYEQAIHAYTRSISLDRNYGRPYGNMALAYVQKGRYGESIDLYLRGIGLLTDNREKALCWHKLGNVYRHLKEYRQAVTAYERADQLAPDLQNLDDSGNTADVLLNRRPTLSDMLSPAEEVEPAPPAPIEPAPLSEELTPWCFDEQSEPDEEPVPVLFEEWFASLDTVAPANEAASVRVQPLTWEIAPEYSGAIVEESVDVEGPAVAPFQADLPLNIPEIQVPVAQIDMQEETPVEVEVILAEMEPAAETVSVPQLEMIPEEIVFHTEDLTSPEAIQYETPTDVQAMDIPPVQLTPAERRSIDIDIYRYKRMLDVNPNNPQAWDMIGGLYKAAGQYNEAILAFQKATVLDPTKAFYFHHLGLVYAAEGRYENAIAAFQKVIEIDPNYSLAHATLGGYYRKRGMEELAQVHIEKARNLLANDENEYNRACMEAICGNSDRALELLEIALKNKQTYVNWAKRDPDLDFIRSDPRFHALLNEHATRPTQ